MSPEFTFGFELIDHSDPHYNQYEAFDFTKLTAVNTCPTWGITRYGMHLAMPRLYDNARSMPLEAGKAMHDGFAAIRVGHLWHMYPDHARVHAVRVFGKGRAESILAVIRSAPNIGDSIRAAALESLSTSGFYDSDYDKRRTLSNLEASLVTYATTYDYERWPVWVANRSDPHDLVGIEQPFAVLVTVLRDKQEYLTFRLTGKIDGLHYNKDRPEVILHENKTASRIDDSWLKSWDTSHQVTGYCVTATLMVGTPVKRAVVRGVQIPLPKLTIMGIQDHWTTRDVPQVEAWRRWLLHTVELYNKYGGDLLNAPMYTHSCNRYFRACPMIPFCTADREEKQQILSEMVTDEWSPLAEEYDT